MKIFVCCSKHNYHKLHPIITFLEQSGHIVTPPNSYDKPFKEEEMKEVSAEAHAKWKADMMRLQDSKVTENDAILVMNFDKGEHKNYIGGATFLEIFRAFDARKKIFLYNPIPENIFTDELKGMQPKVINQDLTIVK